MAWNGSDGGVSGRGTRPACPQGAGAGGGAARTSCVKGLVALAIVVVGGALAWWWVAGRRTHVPDVPEVAHVPSLKGQKTNDKRQTKAVALKCDPPDAIATSVAIPPIADV